MATARHTYTMPLTAVEQDLKEMWEQAELEFSKLTRRTLRTDREKRLEDVIQEFERKYQTPPSESEGSATAERKAKIKGTVLKVLQCVQLLGGLAAQGASIVFGPATLCFNAISFLLDVPGKIASVYEGIESLFEEVSHFLVLSKLSQDHTSLDPALREGTHKLMMCVVRICALSIKIIDGGVGHQIKVGMKITFLNNDSDVGIELAKIRDLIEKQNRITSAVTLQHVLENEKNIAELLKEDYLHTEQLGSIEGKVDILVADMGDRRIQKITTDRVDTIAKMLETSTEPIQEAWKVLQNLRHGLIPGSSQWLFEMDKYTEWKAPNPDVLPLLLLSGGPKTGKSNLLAAIEEDVRGLTGVAVMYYAFSERDNKSSKDRNRDEVISALKSMALQFATQHPPYAKDMASIKGFNPPDGGKDCEKQWWNKLLFTKHAQSDEEVNIILMFDGLDMLPEAEATKLEKLLEEVYKESPTSPRTTRYKLRIVVTGNWLKATKLPDTIKPLQIVEHNGAGIEAYIERELSKDGTLQGQHVEMLELLRSIRTTLPGKASGSFAIVQQKLERIREAIDSNAYLDDVERILQEDPTEDHGKIARKILSDLNTTLTAQEIKQLNELLNWLVFGRQYFTADELRAVMFLESGRSPLQPFENMLKKKYSRILFQEDDGRVTVNQDVDVLFWNDQPTAQESIAPDSDGATISMTVTVARADLRTVQQFFWDLTEKVGISRFDFLEANRTKDGKGFVQCQSFTAHYHIAAQLLKLMNDEPHEKTKILVKYALEYLPTHLENVKIALDEGKLGATERKIIAERLVDLLSDVEGIEKHWNSEYTTYSYWIVESGVETIGGWLNDSETIKVLEPRERRWVRQYTVDTEGKAAFYRPITLMLARRWLQDHDWNHHDTYEWIYEFSRLSGDEHAEGSATAEEVDKPIGGKSDEKSTSSKDTHKTLDAILSAARWAQQTLNLQDEDLNSLWFERVGEACYRAGNHGAARTWYDKARKLPDSGWSVEVKWAVTEATLSEQIESEAEQKSARESACKAMDSALAHLRTCWQSRNDEMKSQERQSFVSSYKDLASSQERLHARDQAIEIYKEALTVDSEDASIYHELLKLFRREKMHEDASKLLSQIVKSSGHSTNSNLFVSVVRGLTDAEYQEDNLDVLDFIMALPQINNTLTAHVLEGLHAAIQDTKNNTQIVNQGILLLYQGIVQVRSATNDTDLQQAIKSWRDCQSLYIEMSWNLQDTKSLASRYIMQHHFNQSIKQDAPSADREEHENKLEKLFRVLESGNDGFNPITFMASYYAKHNRLEDARKIYRNDMIESLGILTDGDPENDMYGYKYLADALMHTGDDLNSLSAWSMLTPSLCKNSFEYQCDGHCGVSWHCPGDMYVCRYCPDTQFTPDCMKKLRAGQLERYICHPDHSWLYIPAWEEKDSHVVGEDKVRVHGILMDNGERIATDIMSKDNWLKEIGEKWGISESEIQQVWQQKSKQSLRAYN